MEDYSREKVYLAALLHDIGKFYQRADTGNVSNSQFLNEYCKTESTFCPLFQGRYTHKHVLWTAQFIEDFRPVFNNLVDANIDVHSIKDNLENLAAGHHLAYDQLSDLGKIIKQADCLSSGMDRSSLEAFRDDQDELDTQWDSFKKKRLIPILETIGNPDKENWHHIPVQRLELTDNCFPKNNFDDEPDYSTLWNQFIAEFKFIQANTYRAFSETLLNLLLKYTSCIPSSTINFADVSLFDHLKTTAALAVCLYDYQHSEKAGDEPFLLIGADFSGIQSYLYQIVSKYAAKNLKGRSFYLRLLSDAVVRYLIKELNLLQANIIYNSGGGFYLLAPNTTFIKKQLDNAIHHIEDKLFSSHGTSIYVSIDCVPLSTDALNHCNGQNLGTVWGNLFIKRDRMKSAKFANLISTNYSSFFEPSMIGGESERDTITGEEFLPGEKIYTENSLKLKRLTLDQIKLGEKLREADLIVIKEGEPLPYWADKLHIEPASLGFVYYLLHVDDVAKMKEQLRSSADQVSVITLNGTNGDCDFLRTLEGINNIYGIEFYGGNEIDRKNVPTFEQMCENENFSRMGVLRMDVDNLGSIFQQGIDPNRATLSRYARIKQVIRFLLLWLSQHHLEGDLS